MWSGVRCEPDEQIHVVPGFDLPLFALIDESTAARLKCSWGSDGRLRLGRALSCGGWLEVTPAPREAEGPC